MITAHMSVITSTCQCVMCPSPAPSQFDVKLLDFGSCLSNADDCNSYVQSRWYRAPEVMLGLQWDGKVDVWGLGCILAEMRTSAPLFRSR